MFGLFGKPSREKFARIVIDAARKAGFTEELEFDAKAFVLRRRDGVMYLGNAYESYCQAERAHRSVILTNFVSALGHTKGTVSRDAALENCVAVIREKALFTFMDLRKQLDGVSPPTPAFEPACRHFHSPSNGGRAGLLSTQSPHLAPRRFGRTGVCKSDALESGRDHSIGAAKPEP